ncbi:MAG: hypothetical protein QF464_23720, partial [Myxococcota bacterium]|nr:hypothetical protein [Myxococcota bacterium]
MMRSRTMVLVTAVFAAMMLACGGGSSPTPDADIQAVPDTPVDEPDAVQPDAEVVVVVPDVEPEVVDEPDVVVEPDVVPDVVVVEPDAVPDVVEEVVQGPECVVWTDCTTKLADQLAECEQADCSDEGVCVIAPINDCCLADEDCPGFDEACCEIITCNTETSQCNAPALKEGCCQASSECADDDPETNDFCATACAVNGCVNLGPLCDNDVTYMTEGFDDPELAGLTVTDTDVFDLVRVSAQKGNTVSPEYSLYFGDPECQT